MLLARHGLLAPQGGARSRSGAGVGGAFPDVGRQRHAGGLEQLAGAANDGGAQDEALAVLFDLDFLQAFEIAHDVAPLGPEALGRAARLQLLAQDQGEE